MTELPADIAAGLEAYTREVFLLGKGYPGPELMQARADLDAAILKRLAELRGSHECVEQHLEDVCAENERLREGMTRVSAELRHAYSQLATGLVSQQRRFADGLIAPQIKRLEALARPAAAEGEPPAHIFGDPSEPLRR